MKLPAQDAILLAAGFDAILADATHGGTLTLGLVAALSRASQDIDELRLARGLRQTDNAGVDLIVDTLRRGVAAVRIVDEQHSAADMRQKRRPMIEQAIRMMHLDRSAPAGPVEPAHEREPVRSGMRAVAGAEALPIRQPDLALQIH